jgi:hypothetical protein
MAVKYQVFISSTYDDLQHERQQVIKAILEMGHIPVGMEMFSAADEEQWSIIKRQIDETDYYVVILAHRYGSTTPEGLSFTEKEYDYAVQQGVPTIGFIIDAAANWPANHVDTDPTNKAALDAFKKKLKQKLVQFWGSADILKGQVAVSLMKVINARPRPGWVRGTEIPGAEVLKELTRLSRENSELRERKLPSQKDETADIRKTFQELLQRELIIAFWVQSKNDWAAERKTNLLILFSYIGPNLMVESSLEKLANSIGLFFYKGKEPLRDRWPVPSNYVRDWLFDLSVYDLVQPSNRKHPVRDQSEYWSLTPRGKKALALYKSLMRDARPGNSSEPSAATAPKQSPDKSTEK